MDREKYLYYLIRVAIVPFGLLPYSWIRTIGNILGFFAFYALRGYRKRTLSNLALATDLNLRKKDLFIIAKRSFQNLAINCLEYAKFSREKDFSKTIICENPEMAANLYAKGQGIIFFCAHQANWEALFLDGTTRMKGIAIGKEIKNEPLYNWIVSIREKNGGKIISPRKAVKESIRALRNGHFVGIVGDQGTPGSGHSSPFLGRRAWTSTAPALLAYKTNSPLIFASTRRSSNGYRIHYSDPIWPDVTKTAEEEVPRLMSQVLTLLEQSIKKTPGEWMWQHNRWKQQTMKNLSRRYRQDCICIIMPEVGFDTLLPALQSLRHIYEPDFLYLFIPEKHKEKPVVTAEKIIYYQNINETLLEDYRFKLVFNLTDYKPIHRHYENLSAVEVLDLPTIQDRANRHLPPNYTIKDVMERCLCRPNSIWKEEN